MQHSFVIQCKLGLESVLAKEIRDLGYSNISVLNGEIEIKGDEVCLARLSIWLRTAERILLKMVSFIADNFDTLFNGASSPDWGEFLPKDAKIRIFPKCINSKLMSGRSVQSIVQKAIVERMKQKYKINWMPETGEGYKIHVDIIKDKAVISLDSSGAGLHKRGYRAQAGEAPLRETIAAAMVLLSNWKPETPLFDPFCGSGTIPIEAAMIGANIAPGIKRFFDAENWHFISKKVWADARKEALSLIKPGQFKVYGSDIDPSMIALAKKNAKKAGIDEYTEFSVKDFESFVMSGDRGMIITNPPYGERLEDISYAEQIIKVMRKVLPLKRQWSYFILSPHPDFEKLFGRKATKNRKLYNGKIKCYLRSYL